MRLIGNIVNEHDAHLFACYLKQKGIEANCETLVDPKTKHLSYHFWIHNEDQIETAAEAFLRFQSNPLDPEFHLCPPPLPAAASGSAPPVKETHPKRVVAPITSFFLSLCIFVFLLNWYQEAQILSQQTGNLLMTPIEESFFFDLPPNMKELLQNEQRTSALVDQIKEEQETLTQMRYWHGAYDWALDKIKNRSTSSDFGPLFYRIGQGEIWRLFTPVLLHGGVLHILFNMIWLWVLGVPIEARIGFFRTLLLTLVIGIGSNVFQYLMGGPFFLGYSGIVVGLAAFTWMREKQAPWEGYPLQRSTILFLLLFVLGMFAIQFLSFLLQIFTSVSFSPNIANTGHISGGILGVLLGYSRFFSRGVK